MISPSVTDRPSCSSERTNLMWSERFVEQALVVPVMIFNFAFLFSFPPINIITRHLAIAHFQ